MNYCSWLISYRVENVVYPAEDKHIHHFRRSFNAKLDYKRHIRSGVETYGPAKTRGRALIIGACLLQPPCPHVLYIHSC